MSLVVLIRRGVTQWVEHGTRDLEVAASIRGRSAVTQDPSKFVLWERDFPHFSTKLRQRGCLILTLGCVDRCALLSSRSVSAQLYCRADVTDSSMQ